MRISISISDPWELGEALSWHPLTGELLTSVKNEHGGRALIKLDNPISYYGSNWRYVVAAPRHQGDEIGALETGKKIMCAFTGIPDEQAEAGSPLDTQNWRGGLAFIGDLIKL